MKSLVGVLTVVALGALWTMGLTGCVTSSEDAQRDTMTAHVGIYDPPPVGIVKPRVGVPPFQVTGDDVESMETVAADQLTTLALRTDRLLMIERAQLEQLLREQNLEGIVRNGELARQAEVRGVDYLFLGKVTNFRVKAEQSSSGFGLGRVGLPYVGSMGAFDYKNRSNKITCECGVDLRLVDPSSGEILDAMFSEYKRTDSIEAIGVDILGANAEAGASLQIDADNKGKILRLALDDAIRKMLPSLDQKLVARSREVAPPAPVAPPPTAVAPPAVAPPTGAVTPPPAETPPATAAAFCGNCGTKLAPGATFCGNCGTKVGS